MCLPKFEDVHPAHNPTGYIMTNEEPELFKKMLGSRTFRRAASIASGGEIPLGILLPRCTELVAVDHSYTSLAVCFMKAALLDQLGGRGLLAMLIESRYPDYQTCCTKLIADLPEVLRNRLTPTDKYVTGATALNLNHFNEMRREWRFYTPVELDKARERLANTTFVHGDLTDLEKFGKFNGIYLSNALEHTGRDGKRPEWDKVKLLLTKNGTVLATWGKGTKPILPGETKTKIAGFRSSWDYYLLKPCVIKKKVITPG